MTRERASMTEPVSRPQVLSFYAGSNELYMNIEAKADGTTMQRYAFYLLEAVKGGNFSMLMKSDEATRALYEERYLAKVRPDEVSPGYNREEMGKNKARLVNSILKTYGQEIKQINIADLHLHLKFGNNTVYATPEEQRQLGRQIPFGPAQTHFPRIVNEIQINALFDTLSKKSSLLFVGDYHSASKDEMLLLANALYQSLGGTAPIAMNNGNWRMVAEVFQYAIEVMATYQKAMGATKNLHQTEQLFNKFMQVLNDGEGYKLGRYQRYLSDNDPVALCQECLNQYLADHGYPPQVSDEPLRFPTHFMIHCVNERAQRVQTEFDMLIMSFPDPLLTAYLLENGVKLSISDTFEAKLAICESMEAMLDSFQNAYVPQFIRQLTEEKTSPLDLKVSNLALQAYLETPMTERSAALSQPSGALLKYEYMIWLIRAYDKNPRDAVLLTYINSLINETGAFKTPEVTQDILENMKGLGFLYREYGKADSFVSSMNRYKQRGSDEVKRVAEEALSTYLTLPLSERAKALADEPEGCLVKFENQLREIEHREYRQAYERNRFRDTSAVAAAAAVARATTSVAAAATPEDVTFSLK